LEAFRPAEKFLVNEIYVAAKAFGLISPTSFSCHAFRALQRIAVREVKFAQSFAFIIKMSIPAKLTPIPAKLTPLLFGNRVNTRPSNILANALFAHHPDHPEHPDHSAHSPCAYLRDLA
jgi:hypothetical protein